MTPEEEQFKAIAKNQEATLRHASKQINNLARFLDKTPWDTPENITKFKSNVSQASFYINAFGLASEAFGKMVTAYNKNPDTENRTIVDFFEDEVKNMREKENKMKEAREAKDVD